MNLLFVAGVEGAGHHMLREVFSDFLSQPTVVDKGDYYPLLLQRWDTLDERLPRTAVVNELQRIVKTYAAAGVQFLFEDTSFPFNLPRNPLRRPDLCDLMDLVGSWLNVRVLVLYRNPISTVYSTLRRGFSSNPALECRITENSHLYLAAQLQQLDPAIYRTVIFEEFIERPEVFLAALGDWAGIAPERLTAGASRIRPSTGLKQIPARTKSLLDSFFSDKRRQQWEPFYHRNPLAP